MPYVINNRSGDTIVIPDEALNQDYSIALVGRNYENYGAIIATGFVDLLNNFATATTPPAKATSGQLWYDSTAKQLRVYDGNTGAWIPQAIQVGPTAPQNTHSQNKAGTAYFNTAVNQLFVHNGLGFRESSISAGAINETGLYTGATIGTPSSYGSRIRHIFLTDTAGVKRSVLALAYVNDSINTSSDDFNQEKIIAIFSGHTDEFTIGDVDSDVDGAQHNFYGHLVDGGDGIGAVIRPGINVRLDSTGRVNFATVADRAQTSYKLNVGSVGSDGANIDAGNVYHNQISILPTKSWQQVGNSTSQWSAVHAGNFVVGNTQPENYIIKHTDASVVHIGLESSPFDSAYIKDLFVTGDIELPAGGSIGSTDNHIESIYANVINANVIHIDGYRLPITAGNTNDMMVLGSTGNVIFTEQPKRINSVESTNNSLLISTTLQTEVDDVENGVLLESQNYNYQINDAYVRGLISTANTSNISYNTLTGEIDITKVTDLDGYAPDSFVRVVDNQTVDGVKTFSKRAVLSQGLAFGTVDNEVTFTNTLGFNITGSESGSSLFTMYSTGDFVAVGDITAFSDSRLKTDLVQIASPLEKIKQLTGYCYNRIDRDDNKRQTGLIAQDVKAVLPEAVSENDNGYLSVAYGNMMGLMVEAIKELESQVAQLKAEVDSLKASK